MVAIFFFFQAEDGIRDWSVTGVQTCALPICGPGARSAARGLAVPRIHLRARRLAGGGRAGAPPRSCAARVRHRLNGEARGPEAGGPPASEGAQCRLRSTTMSIEEKLAIPEMIARYSYTYDG